MSYVKLFGSILDSTVWLEELHVKVVWITILAMKDVDGHVEASVPGLARRAGVTIAQCEDALAKFLAPDPYSRTKDYEGRRIEVIEGGWRVLNHDRYRDQMDAEDQRAKAAERMRRLRARRKGEGERVTPVREHDEHPAASDGGDVTVRHTDPDPDPDPDQRSCGDPDRVEPPLSGADPVQREGGDLVHRGRFGDLVNRFLARVNAARVEVAAKHKLGPVRPVALMGKGGAGEVDLVARLTASADPAGDLEHVLDVAIADAEHTGELRWLGWSVASEKAWRARLAASVAEIARRGPRKGGSVFDGVDAAVAELERKLAGGEP